MAMASRPAPPLATVAPTVPAHVCRIVDQALAFQRKSRYPDALVMLGDVESVRRGQPPPWAIAKLSIASRATTLDLPVVARQAAGGYGSTAVPGPTAGEEFPPLRPQSLS